MYNILLFDQGTHRLQRLSFDRFFRGVKAFSKFEFDTKEQVSCGNHIISDTYDQRCSFGFMPVSLQHL